MKSIKKWICVVAVFEDIYRRFSAKAVPTTGAFLGHAKVKWSLEEVIEKKKAFVYEFEQLLLKREPVYFKVRARLLQGQINISSRSEPVHFTVRIRPLQGQNPSTCTSRSNM